RRLVVLALIAACRSTSPPPAAGIPVFVDDAQVATLTPSDFAARRSLADVVPLPVADWRQLEVAASGNRTMTAQRIAEDVIAYQDDGAPAVGLFRRAADLPAKVRDLAATPSQSIAGVRSIRIRTHEVARP